MLVATPGCVFELERGPDWLLVRIKSLEPDAMELPGLAEEIWSLLERHFTYRLVLEMDGLDVLRSCLIAQLILLRAKIRKHKGILRLCGLSEHNKEVLHTCHLDSRLPHYANRVEAVMGCPSKPR